MASVDEFREIARNLSPLIEAHAESAEAEGELAPDVVAALHDWGLLRMTLPRDFGGGGLSIPEASEVIEILARADAATGWNVAVAAQGPAFAHFLERDRFESIFADPHAWIAGSLVPTTVRAAEDGSGFRFRGRAIYASGSHHANWLVARGVLERNGHLSFVDGFPELVAGIFPIRHATILRTWKAAGMRATGSDDCVFEDVFVPAGATFRGLDPTPRWEMGAFSHIPLSAQLGGWFAAVAVGTARHAVDAAIELAREHVAGATRLRLAASGQLQAMLGEAEGLCQAAHAVLIDSQQVAWQRGLDRLPFTPDDRKHARLGCVMAARLAREATELVHDLGGMAAMSTGNPIERCFRDVHTITQHVMLQPARFEVVGRVALGVEPDSPII